jgi:general secretion pathway protein L
MSTLVVQIAPRRRLRTGDAGEAADAAPRATTEYAFVTTGDGIGVQSQGHCVAALLPRLPNTVAVLADGDVAWHRVTVPKAPAARMRAALAGLLEEALLEEPDAVHLALSPQAAPGQLAWVASVDRRWLQGELAALEKTGITVDRVVPMAWPDDPPCGHFAESPFDGGGAGPGIVLHWSHPDGVASLPIAGGLARALVPTPTPPTTRWSASPGAAAAAEQWLGAPVGVMPAGERALQAARSLWNLRQFELAATRRGTRALRASLRRFFGASWRPVRLGLVALVAVQVVGLNLWAWHQRSQIDARRAAIRQAVLEAFPRVSAIDVQRNAGAVMQREVQALRAQAGRLGDTDLETMLFAAAGAWPSDRPPVASLRYEPGRLVLASTGWSPAHVERFRATLAPAGWQVESTEGSITLRRAPAAGL